MSGSQVIVLVTPAFFLLMALEWAVGRARGRTVFRLADAASSISLGMLSQTSAVFTGLLALGMYTLAWGEFAPWRADAFWHSAPGWLLALLFYDFCYYWHHRAGHRVAVLWAAHAVHHQSQDYNLSTALRQTSSGALLGWVFYLPMALAGVPPLVFVVVGLVDLLYQFWVHTEQVGRLGWFDRWFCSPSNHRVHHAVNERYVDKNYGGILIVWDRLFGSFEDEREDERCVYGTRTLLDSWDPLWANAQVYAALVHESWRARRWRDKLAVWIRPPGWRAPDVTERFPKPTFDIAAMRLFDPAMSPALRRFAALQFVLLLAGVSGFLWHAAALSLGEALIWFAVLLACQWALGAAMQGRLGMWLALMVQAGALATATSALGLLEWHYFAKPAALVFAIVAVAFGACGKGAGGRFGLKPGAPRLLGALLAALAGDVFLMLPGLFLPGLAAFLIAHLCYVALFARGVPWFAHRAALLAALACGGAMYAFLWHSGLPAALRAPVAAYVLAIMLMLAQAWGRWAVLRGAPALLVALGAACFALSDALLAVNRFVAPLPWSALWVLSSYYAAQVLIVTGMLRAPTRDITPGR